MDGRDGRPPLSGWRYLYDPYNYQSWGLYGYGYWDPSVSRNSTVVQPEGQGPAVHHFSSPSANSASGPIGHQPRPPPPQGDRLSLGAGRSFDSPGRHHPRERDLESGYGGKGVLGPGDPSKQLVRPPFLPPTGMSELNPPPGSHSYMHRHGSHPADSSTQPPPPPANTPPVPLPPEKKCPSPSPPPESSLPTATALSSHATAAVPGPVPLSNSTVLSSHATAAVAGPVPLRNSDVDVAMTHSRNDQDDDVLGLNGYFLKKRLLSKTSSLPNVEEKVKYIRKKTRLGFGEGLAKYEKQLREQNAKTLVPDGASGEPGGSSTSVNKATPTVPVPAASSQGLSLTPAGSNGDPGNKSTNTTADMVMVTQVTAPGFSQGCSPPTGDIVKLGNKSTSSTETVNCPTEVIPSPAEGGNNDPCNGNSTVTEAVVWTPTVPDSLPPGHIGGRGNISMNLTEIVICPAEVPVFSLKAVGGNSNLGNSSLSMTGMVVSELASSHGCDLPPAAGTGGLDNSSMSLSGTAISPIVPTFYQGDIGSFDSRSMSIISSVEPAFSHGCRTHPPLDEGANDDLGNKSMSLNKVVLCPEDVPSFSHKCSLPLGDNSTIGNGRSRLTEIVVQHSATVLASSEGSSRQPDRSSNTIRKVRNLISEHTSNSQKRQRMSAIIVQKLQKPTKTLKKNVLSDEQQKYELQGSSFAWSQEEKDVFAEKIATCGINFEKISSFMMHKTAAACLEYYSKHYKSEYSEQAKKCLLTMKQSQEKCKNETTPSMSCITVTSNKNYTRTKKTMEEDIKKPVNQSCHESVARMRFDNLPEGQHVSSMKKNEHATGNVLVDEMNSPSSLGMCSSITNSDQVVCLTISKPDAPELKNLNEDSCSNEEIITGEQEIWTDKEQCRLTQAIEMHGEDLTGISAYVGVKSIQQCKNFLSKCKKDLNIGKKHSSSNIISAVGTCNKSVSNIDSAIGNIMSYSDVMENVSQPAMNVDHGNGANSVAGRSSAKGTLKTVSLPESSGQDVANDAIESYQIRSGKENHVVCAASGECNYGAEQNAIEVKETNSNVDDGSKDPSDMKNPRSDSRPCIAVIDTAQLTGNEFVQALIASEAMDIDSKDNDDRVKSKDINYHVHCVASKECSGIQRSCNVATQNGKEEVDTISSREGNDLFNALPMQTSNEATKFYDLSSGSDSVASEITYANTSRAQMDINLNTILDVAPLDADSLEKNHGEASLSLNEPHQATDSAAMEHDESVVRQQATIDNLGANNVTVNDATHVQKIHESHTTVPEITHQPANQPSIMLFGQVIYPVQSSRINPTSNQGNQAVVRSSYDMPSNNTVVVPARSRGDQVYLPGPSTSRSAPVNLGQQQTVLSNRIGYGSTNGAAAWPVSPGSSALTNMSRQRHLQPVNMTPYRMTRGGAPYHPRPGESSSSRLINFNDFNPGQQWSPSTILDTSALVMGYPYLTDSTQNQAPSGTLTFGINGEGASTSNTWSPAAGRGRGHNPWLAFRRSSNQ